MRHEPNVARTQAIAVPYASAAPGPLTEWIVAAIAVLLLLVGLAS